MKVTDLNLDPRIGTVTDIEGDPVYILWVDAFGRATGVYTVDGNEAEPFRFELRELTEEEWDEIMKQAAWSMPR
jgi:hypothetical protein